jgi:UDP-glucose 4-epimerase
MPLSMSSSHLIPTFKTVSELLGDHLAGATGIEIVHYRISGTWGPLGHNPDPFFPAPQLVHAAAHGRAADLSGLRGRPHAEDSLDLCYVKDTGRAIALLQLADRLNHRTYNVASGRATSNAEVIAAIKQVVPDAHGCGRATKAEDHQIASHDEQQAHFHCTVVAAREGANALPTCAVVVLG